jgi:hypothetical protein
MNDCNGAAIGSAIIIESKITLAATLESLNEGLSSDLL